MMQRYNSSYGGIETVIGQFTTREIVDYMRGMTDPRGESWAKSLLQNMRMWDHRTAEKLMDIALDDSRELLIYGTSADYLEMRIINRHRVFAS